MMQLTTLIIPFLMLFIIVHGVRHKVAVYEVFVDGAQQGFHIAIKIIPYLVAMLFAIAMFRSSGALEILLGWLSPVFGWFNIPPEVTHGHSSPPNRQRFTCCIGRSGADAR